MASSDFCQVIRHSVNAERANSREGGKKRHSERSEESHDLSEKYIPYFFGGIFRIRSI